MANALGAWVHGLKYCSKAVGDLEHSAWPDVIHSSAVYGWSRFTIASSEWQPRAERPLGGVPELPDLP